MIDLSAYGVDVSSLEAGIGGAVVSELAPVLNATEDDLRTFGVSVARHGVRAFLTGDALWTAEVKAQARGLLEDQRVKVEAVDWDLVEKIVSVAVKAALSGAASLIPGASALPGLGSALAGLFRR